MNILHIISIVCFALCLVMFFYLKWHIRRRISESGMHPNTLEEHRTEIIKLIAEINSVTDRDLQLVEDRVSKLKGILLDVDKRIALYEKELEQLRITQSMTLKEKSKHNIYSYPEIFSGQGKSRTNETLYTSLGKGIRAAFKTPEEVAASLPSIIPPPEPALVMPVQPAPEIKKPPSKKQIRAEIDLLANEGLPPKEIASRLDISVAEVNLAMNLRRNK
jgi:hypothetical protein